MNSHTLAIVQYNFLHNLRNNRLLKKLAMTPWINSFRLNDTSKERDKVFERLYASH